MNRTSRAECELRNLHRGYGKVSNEMLAGLFGVSLSGLRNAAFRLGLTDPTLYAPMSATTKRRLAALRVQRNTELAAHYGLPLTLTPNAVRVVLAL